MASVKEIIVNGVLTLVTMFDHSAQEIDDTVDGHKGLQEEFNDFKANGKLKPTAHAATHAEGGSDPITPASIGAYSKDETYNKEEVDRIASTGGGLLPQIIVTALIGSTVTCVKGDITMTVEEVDGTWTFEVPEYGEWTIYGAYLTLSTGKRLTVDSVKQYPISLFFYEPQINYTMLYDNGDECTTLTGGVETYGTVDQGYLESQKKDTTIYHSQRSSGGEITRFAATVNNISLSEYCELAAKTRFTVTATTYGAQQVIAAAEPSVAHQNGTAVHVLLSQTLAFHKEVQLGPYDKTGLIGVDISALEEAVPMVGLANMYTGKPATLTIYTIFLVKEDAWENLCDLSEVAVPETLDYLLLDASALTRILDLDAAVQYMISCCTGAFMLHAVQSEAFLTALEASPYKERVYANEHWAKFLAMVA